MYVSLLSEQSWGPFMNVTPIAMPAVSAVPQLPNWPHLRLQYVATPPSPSFSFQKSHILYGLKGYGQIPPCSDCMRRYPSRRCLDLSCAQKWISKIPKVCSRFDMHFLIQPCQIDIPPFGRSRRMMVRVLVITVNTGLWTALVALTELILVRSNSTPSTLHFKTPPWRSRSPSSQTAFNSQS